MKPRRSAVLDVISVAAEVLTTGFPRVENELTLPYVMAQLLVVTVCQ